MISLKRSLEKMTHGNPFATSDYWSKGFHPPTDPLMLSGFPEEPTDLGRPDPDAAERISRANPGDGHRRAFGGSGDLSLRDRAGNGMGDGEGHRHLLCGSGDVSLWHRARMSMGVGEVHGHSRGGSGDVPHQARAGMDSNHEECHGHLRGGSGHQALQARALHGDPGECLHDRAPQSSHSVCHANRALQGSHGKYPGVRAGLLRALMEYVMTIGLFWHRSTS